jgi:hypothetical protein
MERDSDAENDRGFADEAGGAGEENQRITFPRLIRAVAYHYGLTPEQTGAMSGPQHIAWYETAIQETGLKKLLDLQVLVAPNEQNQFERVRDMLVEMATGK